MASKKGSAEHVTSHQKKEENKKENSLFNHQDNIKSKGFGI